MAVLWIPSMFARERMQPFNYDWHVTFLLFTPVFDSQIVRWGYQLELALIHVDFLLETTCKKIASFIFQICKHRFAGYWFRDSGLDLHLASSDRKLKWQRSKQDTKQVCWYLLQSVQPICLGTKLSLGWVSLTLFPNLCHTHISLMKFKVLYSNLYNSL